VNGERQFCLHTDQKRTLSKNTLQCLKQWSALKVDLLHKVERLLALMRETRDRLLFTSSECEQIESTLTTFLMACFESHWNFQVSLEHASVVCSLWIVHLFVLVRSESNQHLLSLSLFWGSPLYSGALVLPQQCVSLTSSFCFCFLFLPYRAQPCLEPLNQVCKRAWSTFAFLCCVGQVS
jgi:hypothetical protein